jgi:LAO/AO transport system kinase
VVVLVPGVGDEIQMIKAGILEIADIFVVNKAHVPGAEKMYGDLINRIQMEKLLPRAWIPPVIKTGNREEDSFTAHVGILLDMIKKHFRFISNNKKLSDWSARRRIAYELKEVLYSRIFEPIYEHLSNEGELESAVSKIMEKKTDPYSVADDLVGRFSAKIRRNKS